MPKGVTLLFFPHVFQRCYAALHLEDFAAGGVLGRLLLHHQPAANPLLGVHLLGPHEQQAICGICPLHCAGHH